MYRDENGVPKGDALCTYVKVESVDLALTIIDGSTEHSKVIKIKIESLYSVKRSKTQNTTNVLYFIDCLKSFRSTKYYYSTNA